MDNKFIINNEDNSDNKNRGKLALSKIMDIETFEQGVREGLYTDEKGTAYLILNGTLYSSYNVYINRRRITKAGSVVSFESLLKSYKPEDIQIRFDAKEQKLPSLRAYRDSHKKS